MRYHQAINWGRFWCLLVTWGLPSVVVALIALAYFTPQLVRIMEDAQ